MGLIIVNHNMTKEKDFIVGEEICNREQERETSREILKLVLTGTITMGGWQNLNDTLIKSSSVLLIDESIEKILKKTCELANTKITNGVKGREKYHSVVNWRNLAIAHGIITMDEERYWRQLKDLLFAINRYLGKSEREFCCLLYTSVTGRVPEFCPVDINGRYRYHSGFPKAADGGTTADHGIHRIVSSIWKGNDKQPGILAGTRRA